MKAIFGGIIVSTLVFSPVAAHSAEPPSATAYQGAASLLRQIDEQTKQPAPEEKPSEHKKLANDITAFSTNGASLKASEAARQWLGLVDRYLTLAPEVYRPGEEVVRIQSSELLRTLPPPGGLGRVDKTH